MNMKVINNNIISNYSAYLTLIFPISLILGPTFVEIFSGLLIIFFLFCIDSNFYKKNKFYINFFLIFYSYLIIRSLFFSHELEKIRSILFYFRFLLFCCGIVFFLNKINFTKRFNIKIIFFIFLILIFDSILQYYYGNNIFNIPLYNDSRASSFFGKELILGSFLFRILPFILILCVLCKFNFNKNFFKFSIFLSLYFFAVLISGERTSFFLLILTIFLLIILIRDLRKILYYSLIFFLLINLIFSFSNKKPFDRMFKHTLIQIVSEKKSEKLDQNLNISRLEVNQKSNFLNNFYIFSREHHGHYIISVRMFLENPIFGQGPRSFRYLCSEDRFIKTDGICTTHPHNTYLQLLAETGLIGFCIVFLLFLFSLKEILKKMFSNLNSKSKDSKFLKIKYISLIAIFVSLFPLAPSGNFFNNWLSFVYYYPLAFYVYSINKLYSK